jgi:DNA-binding NtrC family response regulator
VATVLYVDDEDAIRRALTSWLTRRGHTVLTAGSSEAALAILKANKVDALFIDIWLGNEYGFDLFEWVDLNQPELGQHTAFVTGAIVRDPEVERSLASFARPILVKPFELTELERLVVGWTSA